MPLRYWLPRIWVTGSTSTGSAPRGSTSPVITRAKDSSATAFVE